MFLSIATTHRPATDLGYLLHKHPERLHEIELAFGRAWVFYPGASDMRCEAALLLDVDPVGLVRGKGQADGLLDQYVNDRPYAASSFLSVALNRAFRTAMSGVCNQRQELADRAIPLEAVVTPLPTRGGEKLVRLLFEPLGWSVHIDPIVDPDMTAVGKSFARASCHGRRDDSECGIQSTLPEPGRRHTAPSRSPIRMDTRRISSVGRKDRIDLRLPVGVHRHRPTG